MQSTLLTRLSRRSVSMNHTPSRKTSSPRGEDYGSISNSNEILLPSPMQYYFNCQRSSTAIAYAILLPFLSTQSPVDRMANPFWQMTGSLGLRPKFPPPRSLPCARPGWLRQVPRSRRPTGGHGQCGQCSPHNL